MSDSHAPDRNGFLRERSVTLGFERFAWQTIDEEAAREGVTVEELVVFSVLYYLADLDSGRIARRIPSNFLLQTGDLGV